MKTFKKTLLASLLFVGCSHLAMAEMTEYAGQLIGTVPVLKGTGSSPADHSVSFSNDHKSGSTEAMSPGDKITLIILSVILKGMWITVKPPSSGTPPVTVKAVIK